MGCSEPSRRDNLDGSDPHEGGAGCAPNPVTPPAPNPSPDCRTSGKKGGVASVLPFSSVSARSGQLVAGKRLWYNKVRKMAVEHTPADLCPIPPLIYGARCSGKARTPALTPDSLKSEVLLVRFTRLFPAPGPRCRATAKPSNAPRPNRSNGTTGIVAEIDGFLRLPCTVAVPIFFATYIRGYLWHSLWHSLWHTHFVYFFASLLFDCYYQAIPRQKERRGKDESDPPFFAVLSANRKRGLWQGLGHTLPPLFWGSLSSDLSLREGCRADEEDLDQDSGGCRWTAMLGTRRRSTDRRGGHIRF